MLTLIFCILHWVGAIHYTWWGLLGTFPFDVGLVLGVQYDFIDGMIIGNFIDSWFDNDHHDW